MLRFIIDSLLSLACVSGAGNQVTVSDSPTIIMAGVQGDTAVPDLTERTEVVGSQAPVVDASAPTETSGPGNVVSQSHSAGDLSQKPQLTNSNAEATVVTPLEVKGHLIREDE